MPSWLPAVVDELADITIVTVALFLLLRALRGARARLAFVGVLFIGRPEALLRGARGVGAGTPRWPSG